MTVLAALSAATAVVRALVNAVGDQHLVARMIIGGDGRPSGMPYCELPNTSSTRRTMFPSFFSIAAIRRVFALADDVGHVGGEERTRAVFCPG